MEYERIREILEKCPCIQCEGNGYIPVNDGEGGCVAEQCQFCWEKRFPFIDQAEAEMNALLEKIHKGK